MKLARLVEFIEKHDQRLLIMLLVASLICGIVYSFNLGDDIRFQDEADYLDLAINLIEKGVYSETGSNARAFRPPGYPFFETSILLPGKLLGLSNSTSLALLRILNYSALLTAAFLLYRLVRARAGAPAALIVATMVIGYPLNFFTAGTLYPQAIALLFIAVALTLLFGITHPRSVHYLLLGTAHGIAILTVPALIFVLFFVCAWMLFTHKKQRIRSVCLTIVACLIIMAPWSIRNYLTFDSFVLISTNSGANLLLGNSEYTGPNTGINVDVSKYKEEAIDKQLNEIALNKFYTQKAVDYVLNNKVDALKLYCLKFLNYFNFQNELASDEESSSSRWFVMFITYGFILVAGLPLRLLLATKKAFALDRMEVFSLLLYVSNGLFAAIFFTRIRFRMPFDILLMISVAILAGLLIQHYLRQSKIVYNQ